MKKILIAILAILSIPVITTAQTQPCVTLKQVFDIIIEDADPAVVLKNTCLKEYSYHRFDGRLYGMAWGQNVKYELTNPYFMKHDGTPSTIFVYSPDIDNWILSSTDTALLPIYLKEAQEMGFRFTGSEEGKATPQEDGTTITAYDLQWTEAPTPYHALGIVAHPDKVVIYIYNPKD